MTVLPRVTWPSPPIATAPLRRTATMVVPWGSNPLLSDIGLLICRGMARCPSGRRLSFLPRAGMGFVVDTGEVLEIKVGVNLGRRNIGVAQQLLHATQISTRFKDMRCKRMPEQVGVYA